MKQVKCGCEFNADTLVSLCPSHAAYFAEKFRREAPERATLNSKQEALRDKVIVEASGAYISRNRPMPLDQAAQSIVAFATAVAART